MVSESKWRTVRGCLPRRNGEYNKDQEQQLEDKEPLFIRNAQMSDRQLQYRLHIGGVLNPAHIGIFLTYNERL